ncbi:uncharacterized protein LOC143467983 [Clavelina lepadiformis]|uniref:Uncharacterized protein n=1 Tax=Clavelina lepadiformis TaxID=159417 RepID=A0ABP0G724_CLALP
MKLLSFCLFIAILSTKLCNADDECFEQKIDLIVNGTCVSDPANRLPCCDLCTGIIVVGEQNCSSNIHCCFEDGFCYLKQLVEDLSAPKRTFDIDALGKGFQDDLGGSQDDDSVSSRTGFVQSGLNENVLAYLSSGGNPAVLCPKFPATCGPLFYNNPNDIQPTLNVPYCQRIACQAENPLLEFDFAGCLGTPGCAFDYELYLYRSVLSQAILPGVPVCHLAIRNRAFQTRAAEYVQQTGSWNPLLTNCLIREYEGEIYGDTAGCSMVNVLEEVGFKAKRVGWKDITSRDCSLINGCWRGNGVCVYSLPLTNIKVRSSHDVPVHQNIFFGQDHGRPICLPFDDSAKDSEFLDSYHSCLRAGCAADVDSETILKHLRGVSFSYLPLTMQHQYWAMALLGEVRADNWKEVADNLIESSQAQGANAHILNQVLPSNILGTSSTNFSGLPFSIALNISGHSSLQNAFTTFGSFGQFGTFGSNPDISPRSLGVPDTQPTSNSFNLGNTRLALSSGHQTSQSLNTLQNLLSGIGIPPPIPVEPRFEIPCPYKKVQWFNFPPLKGSFEGCCEKPTCYLPKEAIRDGFSGIASYRTLWSSWSPCSTTCGWGQSNRRRHCVGDKCGPFEEQTHICNQAPCAVFSPWGTFSNCTASCGGGTRYRSRFCITKQPCVGPTRQVESCMTGACPIFRTISPWSRCNVNCGEGKQTRRRICVSGGASGCPDNPDEERKCLRYCGGMRPQFGECDKTTCTRNVTSACLKGDGTPGYCRRKPIQDRTVRCC